MQWFVITLAFRTQNIFAYKCLALGSANEDVRTLFDQLMSHVETKGDFVEHWSECLRNYEEFVEDDRFSRDEIERTMGMVDTNAHAVGNGAGATADRYRERGAVGVRAGDRGGPSPLARRIANHRTGARRERASGPGSTD